MGRGKKAWKAWTAEEEATLASLRLEGCTVAQIAAVLGRTPASVVHGLERDYTPRAGVAARWLEAFAKPHTLRGVAAEFGVTLFAVKRAKNRLRRSGFKVPRATGLPAAVPTPEESWT